MCRCEDPAWWPGGDRLSRILRCSTMGAEVFHGRVRDGIGCIILAMTTGPPSRILTTDEGCWIWMCVCVLVADGTRLGAARGWGDVVANRPWPVRRWGIQELYRAIRTARLRRLPPLHLRPINVVVFHGPRRDLVSRLVSRLDAFSGYPFRTWPPGRAAGATTGSPEVRPSRSSRTRERSSQVSYTHSR